MNKSQSIVGDLSQSTINLAQLPFGVRSDGRLVGPTEVPRGAACGCTCPGCGQPLIARHGSKRRPHFSHASGNEPCSSGGETGLHRVAKQILMETRTLGLPELVVRRHLKDSRGLWHEASERIASARKVESAQVALEVERPPVGRPDAVMRLPDDIELLVEFRVTHAVDEDKRERCRQAMAAMLEIDLRDWSGTGGEAGLRQFLLGTIGRYWISHPGYQETAARLEKQLRRKIEAEAQRLRSTEIELRQQPKDQPLPAGKIAPAQQRRRGAPLDGHHPYGELGQRYLAQFGRYPTLEQAIQFCPGYFFPLRREAER